MKKSEIKISVELDEQNIPEKITWDADEKQGEGPSETKSVSLSLWDDETKNTLRIDLWAKDMPVEDMKRFYIDCIGGMAQSILNSTGDEFMSSELNAVCDRFVTHLKNEMS
ncbi:MAG: gliding motility protein GldC [Flammeovirgaceae bacterium]|mgnify:FL=1|nr:gliding motility protein GldC [Flammeovirgaceae bacterium]MBE63625.1 gliding motility protein GldC [Flammeovirgaceae bacterium]MBR10182.1 gliding motility protein GldC [Rickettsiales bacterium]HCX22208.1 gliding motility protein GldC [Cytophagales bacterium]|tara:strand:+ start:5501 stop:5833 length:333 start_codon:yes stop_codon:yes gene_type:complete